MSVIAAGLNYQVADVSVIESLSFASERLPKALSQLMSCDHVTEGVVISTCNRVEVFVRASRFHPAAAEVREFLGEFHHVAPERFSDCLYTYFDEAAIAHLFAVVAGLDSMVIGEGEIAGQVKSAFAIAQAEGAAGRTMSALFRRAFEVGKRIRNETGISKNAASVSSAAVALASQELGGLEGKSVAVLGAGEAGQAAAKSLLASGAAELVVINRSVERGAEVADRVGGRACGLDELDSVIDAADILVASTRSPGLVLDLPAAEEIAARRGGRPLLIVDIAVPRDVDVAVRGVDGVTLLDLDDLKAFAEEGRRQRAAEAIRGREIISEEVERFLEDELSARYGPLISELRAEAEELRAGEFERYSRRLSNLSLEDRETVEALTRSLANKFLHAPTVRMRELASMPDGEVLADSLVKLFGLEGTAEGGGEAEPGREQGGPRPD